MTALPHCAPAASCAIWSCSTHNHPEPVERVGAARGGSDLRPLEFAAIELSLTNLLTFPFVRALVERGRVQLHGAYFGVADGVLLVREPKTGTFDRLVAP